MLTSEYNRIFCVHRAARYGTLAKSLDWAVLMVSGGAVASWAAGLPAGVSVGISLLVAVLGGTSRAFQWYPFTAFKTGGSGWRHVPMNGR